MAANSSIEWTDTTWNPVVGCSKVSPGCAHCYAETMATRLKGMALADIAAGRDPGKKRHYIEAIDDKGRWSGKLIPAPESLADPLGWRKPRRVFVNSMSDLFHEDILDLFIAKVFASMGMRQRHTFQVLTKRAERMHDWFRWIADQGNGMCDDGLDANLVYQFISDEEAGEQVSRDDFPELWPLPNVWLGVSCEDQQRADERIPWLLKTPAAVRFLSCEPLLGPIDLSAVCNDPKNSQDALCFLDWVIVGGESGPGARPCNIAWVRSIVEQCKAAGVACFVKQLGSKPVYRQKPPFDGAQPLYSDGASLKDKKGGDQSEWPIDMRVRQMPAPRGE